LISPSLFKETELSRFQIVNPNAVPMSMMSRADREGVLATLTTHIASLVKQRRNLPDHNR